MTELEIPDSGAVFTFGKSRFAENKPSHFFIKNDPVVHVACGDEHTAVICKNGRIFAFGSNEWGQLGLGHNNMVHKPSCVKALKPEKAKFIACGRAHTIILTDSNNIYACGSNTDGQLGLDNVDMVNTPTKLNHSQLKEHGTIKKLSAGSQHSAALTESGLVFVWGSNSEGQLGLESNRTNCKLPTLLEFKDKIRDISCGYYHSAVLTESGELYTFGENENGKLGVPQGDSQCYKPTLVKTPLPLASICCGGRHNIGLTEEGEAVAFGSNTSGELGLDREVTCVIEPQILPNELFGGEKVREVSCGESHTAFVTENFKIFTCGDTRHGKLCQEDSSEEGQFAPEQISRFTNYKVTNVSCGGCHTIICAEKMPEDLNALPPLQRIPNSILNPEKTEVAVETIADLTAENIAKELTNGIDSHKEMINGVVEDLNDMKINGFTELEKVSDELIKNVENTGEDTIDGISNLPPNISEIIKSQKEQLDANYDKTINNLKNESKAVGDDITNAANDLKESAENIVNDAGETIKSGIHKIDDNCLLKPLKENIPSDSVDNLLQEIEDDLSSKSGKTFTSDTISVKSNGKHSDQTNEEIEEVNTETKENDEEDLKTEVPVVHSEKRLSKLFSTFKRKKVSSTSTIDSKIIDTDSTKRKNSLEIKNENEDEITVSKTDKTKTCTLL